jgi:elongation factor Ts
MMAISVEQIKILREKTGAGLMEVRAALTEAEGNIDKAVEILRQKGAATAEKKASRATAEGKVAARTQGKSAILVEVNCETDFSANNERFLNLVSTIADTAIAQPYDSVEALLAASIAEGTVKNLLTDTIGAVKENMGIARTVRFELAGEGLLHTYLHGAGKIGVLLEMTCNNAASVNNPAFAATAKDIAMQIAAYAPEFVSRDEIPADITAEETRIEMGKEDLQNKPEAIRAKIVEGRVEKNLAGRVLLLQEFVKDPSKKVGDVIAELSKTVNDTVTLTRFVRYALGETAVPNEPEEEDPLVAAAKAAACTVG